MICNHFLTIILKQYSADISSKKKINFGGMELFSILGVFRLWMNPVTGFMVEKSHDPIKIILFVLQKYIIHSIQTRKYVAIEFPYS